jgi:hypothetical protein
VPGDWKRDAELWLDAPRQRKASPLALLAPDNTTGNPFTGTVPIVLPGAITGRRRREDAPATTVLPAPVQLAAAIAAVGFAWAGVAYGTPIGLLLVVSAVGILAAAFTPDIVARYDAQAAALQETIDEILDGTLDPVTDDESTETGQHETVDA